MSGLCITAGKLLLAIPVSSFTLAWTPPGDSLRWEQQWRVSKGELRLLEAKKPRAGLALDTVLTGDESAKQNFVLSNAPGAPVYELCLDGRCRPLLSLLSGIEANSRIEFSACPERGTE